MAAYTGVLHNDTSDLTPFVNENRSIKQATTSDTASVSLTGNEIQYWGFITESGVPNNVWWEQGGDWTVEYVFVVGNHKITGRFRCVRIDNNGTILESGSWSSSAALNVNTDFSLPNQNWNRSDENANNRLAVEFEITNTDSNPQSCSFGVNTITNEVITNISSGLVWTEESSGIELFIEGFQAGTAISGNIDLCINSFDYINDNIDLFIHGYQTINNYIDLNINSHQNINDNLILFVYGLDIINDNINLVVAGHQSESDLIELFVSGIVGITSIDNNTILNIYGHQDSNDNIVLFINGLNQINDFITLNLGGYKFIDTNITSFVNGLGLQTNFIELLIDGNATQNDFISLFASGLGFITNNISLYISSITTATNNIILFVNGPNFESNDIDFYIDGFTTLNDQIDLFIRGYQEINNSIILFITSAQLITDNILCYIKGSTTHNDNIDLLINGYDFITDDITLFIQSHSTVNDNISLFINGSGIVPNIINYSLELYITTPSFVPIDNNINLLINGYIPIPETECPTLDPTTSIQITPELIDIYQSRIDALINQIGKHVLLEFDPNKNPCPNCIFDPMRQRSTGIYITNPPGPRPFKRNKKCPWCKGRGYEETQNTKCIDALIKWNPRNAKKYGITLTNRKDIVRIKTFITDADDLIRAKTAIVDYDQRNITIARTKMIRSPIPVGLRDSRYCISFWELL